MEALGNGEGGKKKLYVEDYLDFVDDRTLSLTVKQLREIIGMHGFKKIEAQKSILAEMVATMELMDLQRSTLLDGVSGDDACLTLKEVMNDLKFLNWQDCHVTSVLTYGGGGGGTSPSSAGDRTVSPKRKRSKSSGKKAVRVDAADDSVISTTGTTTVAGRTTGRSAHCSSAETQLLGFRFGVGG